VVHGPGDGPLPPDGHPLDNPLTRNYRTSDGRTLAFTCLQAGKYWAPLCEAVGRPDLAADERFGDHASLMANSPAAGQAMEEVFASKTVDEWRELLAGFSGQWCVVQHTQEAAADPQSVANGYIQECETAAGIPYHLVAVPVQYDGEPARPRRAPEFNEHGDAILAELGLDEEAILDLKIRGVVA